MLSRVFIFSLISILPLQIIDMESIGLVQRCKFLLCQYHFSIYLMIALPLKIINKDFIHNIEDLPGIASAKAPAAVRRDQRRLFPQASVAGHSIHNLFRSAFVFLVSKSALLRLNAPVNLLEEQSDESQVQPDVRRSHYYCSELGHPPKIVANTGYSHNLLVVY